MNNAANKPNRSATAEASDIRVAGSSDEPSDIRALGADGPSNDQIRWALNLPTFGQGVRFFCNLPGFDFDEELSYDTLVSCLRMDDEVDTDGFSDAELHSGPIVDMLIAGTIEHAVWGVVSTY